MNGIEKSLAQGAPRNVYLRTDIVYIAFSKNLISVVNSDIKSLRRPIKVLKG